MQTKFFPELKPDLNSVDNYWIAGLKLCTSRGSCEQILESKE